ncbi:hypothetical protein CBM2598_U30026 [Cupriavidus taiwanensis]|nr:hypothetical protein CBM2598_U30026 [Cupriavidus taiwanensis]
MLRRLVSETAVEDGQRARGPAWHRVGVGGSLADDYRHQRRLNQIDEHGLERWNLRAGVVGRFGAKLAVLQAQAVMGSRRFGLLRHVGTGLGHTGHVRHTVHRIPAARAGVGRRCQLNCQEGTQQEGGKAKPAKADTHVGNSV